MLKSKQTIDLKSHKITYFHPMTDMMVNTILRWNYGPFYDIWRHIWGHNDDLALPKVKISYSDLTIDMTIMILGWKCIKIQIYSSIRSFSGILTLFEWNFGLPYDIWRQYWRHNHILAFIKSKCHNFDITIGLPSQKYSPIRFPWPTQSFY